MVENTTDKKFIEKEALKTILLANEHSREFHFYGKQAQRWENAFDLADVIIHPDTLVQEVALTMVYCNLEEFVEMLQKEISVRHIVPHDNMRFECKTEVENGMICLELYLSIEII